MNAASNLLGICFVVIGGLKLANRSAKTYSDEFAWLAVILFLVSIIISYLTLRNREDRRWHLWLADWSFLGGLGAIVVSVVMAATQL